MINTRMQGMLGSNDDVFRVFKWRSQNVHALLEVHYNAKNDLEIVEAK